VPKKLNFKGVPEDTLVPTGSYSARVVEAWEPADKDDEVKLKFAILAPGDFGFAGATVMDTLFLREKALPRVRLILKAFGMEPDAKGDLVIDPQALLNKRCTIHVVHESYEGQDRMKLAYAGCSQQVPKGPTGGNGTAKTAPLPKTDAPGGAQAQLDDTPPPF
jgi:hypothetical protein